MPKVPQRIGTKCGVRASGPASSSRQGALSQVTPLSLPSARVSFHLARCPCHRLVLLDSQVLCAIGFILGPLPLPGPAWGGGLVTSPHLISPEACFFSPSFSRNWSYAGHGVPLTQLFLGSEWSLRGDNHLNRSLGPGRASRAQENLEGPPES